jgi:ADP-ribose pyrophosphatase YjhB (NUDIX family)
MEKELMESYDINRYERPSLAADVAVFTIGNGMRLDNRKLPQKKLRILMIRRDRWPFEGLWSLPGGFTKKGETIYETARRKLKEKTGTDKAYLELCHVFSDNDRDPRGWIISQSFMAILNNGDLESAQASNNNDACWFDVNVSKISENKHENGKGLTCDNDYKLTLQRIDGEDLINAVIREHLEYKDYHVLATYQTLSSENIAFDHARIITCIFNRLVAMLNYDIRMAFDFLPEYFTLTDLQEIVETITGTELIKPNFRRKIADYVLETDKVIQNGAHRPAKAYSRNLERFY